MISSPAMSGATTMDRIGAPRATWSVIQTCAKDGSSR